MTALQALIEVIGTIAKHRVSHFAYNGEVKSYAHMQAELLKAQQEEVDKISQLTVDALLKELHAIQEVK